MPPRRVKKTFKILSFKNGRLAKTSRLTVPLTIRHFTSDSASSSASSSAKSSINESYSFLETEGDLLERQRKKPKIRKIKLKRKLKAYHVRKTRLAESWLNSRKQLVSALLERHTLPTGQLCVLTACEEEAVGRCFDCGPAFFLCEAHLKSVHADGRSLHHPEVWKDGRYMPYLFDTENLVWTTSHNKDHGYVRDIVAIGINGQQHRIHVKCCDHEPEAVTLIRNGLWPSTPKQPQVAFDLKLMTLLQCLFLECRVSLKTIYQALQWLAPSLSKVYVKDIYRLLVGDCFSEFRYISSILENLTQFNPLLNNEIECPACPKDNGNIYISVDALFGCVRKCSAGTSGKGCNHGEALFINQEKVDSFLSTYNKKTTNKSSESCNQFQAGSNLRSKNKSKKLDETAVFGASCRHEVPLKFFSLKRGEEIGNAVFLLQWVKELLNNKAIDIYFFYDIACVLDTHLRNTKQEKLLENVKLAIPAFHCYGHKVSCQVNYSGRRLEGFGLSDGEVMERLWSYLRPTAKITKEMTPAHRVDALTDFLMHYSKKSISTLGERLCDHLRKAIETQKETEGQLNLLLTKLNETGANVEQPTVEEWSAEEKSSITKHSTGKKTDSSALGGYPEKLRQYYSVRTNLQSCSPGSDSSKILTIQLDRLDNDLKKNETGPRWLPDSSLYLSYIRELEDQRRRDLLLSMHGKCSERWFLLQLMKKYADGQAIAKKLCAQITKTTNAVKQLVKEYERHETHLAGCKYPAKIIIEEALDITSPLWRVLESDADLPSSVPYCIKRQLIDLNHLHKRCTEEVLLIKEEMDRVNSYYEGKLNRLNSWTNELAVSTESVDSRGLLSVALTKVDELTIFTRHLQGLFSAHALDKEAGVLEDVGDINGDDEDDGDRETDEDGDGDDIAQELDEADVLADLRSVLNVEYGSDDESDSGNSDSDAENN